MVADPLRRTLLRHMDQAIGSVRSDGHAAVVPITGAPRNLVMPWARP